MVYIHTDEYRCGFNVALIYHRTVRLGHRSTRIEECEAQVVQQKELAQESESIAPLRRGGSDEKRALHSDFLRSIASYGYARLGVRWVQADCPSKMRASVVAID